jgi:hypothetical protein
MKSTIAMLLCAAFLLGGCATVDNRHGAEKFAYAPENPEEAVVILSLGATEKCFNYVTRLKLLPAAAPYSGPMIASLPVDSYVIKSEYTDHHGYLHVLRLKPGSYYLAPFINNPRVKVSYASRADFSVKAGEVVYLGEYFLEQACGLSTGGQYRDQADRDLELLKSKNPALSRANIQKRILRTTGKVEL